MSNAPHPSESRNGARKGAARKATSPSRTTPPSKATPPSRTTPPSKAAQSSNEASSVRSTARNGKAQQARSSAGSNATTAIRHATKASSSATRHRPAPPATASAAAATTAARAPRPRRRAHAPHIPALDGLRALAIAAVVLYHLQVTWLPSGHLGVVMFLVLTGYLVTSSLLRSIRQDGSVRLTRFWARRLARIWPPMALAILVTVVACMAANHILLTKLKPDLVPSLLFFSNIAAIVRGASYFDNLGGTSPLTHLWYLGLDAQFCLVWPLVVVLFSRVAKGRTVPRRVTLGLTAASAIAMVALFVPNADPTRVYYGPDTRSFAPLLGAWLAYAWPLGTRPRPILRKVPVPSAAQLSVLGVAGLCGLVAMMLLVPGTSTFLYRVGMVLAALCTVALIASLLDRRTVTTRVLASKPLVWLGQRAFGIYLWHFPLFQLVHATDAATPVWVVVLATAASVALAQLSLTFVERPIAQGWLRTRLQAVRADDPQRRKRALRSLAAPTAVAAALAVATVLGCNLIPDETALPTDALNNTGAGAATAVDLSAQSSDSDSSDSADQQATTDSGIILHASDDEKNANIRDPFIISDSVAGDTDWYFQTHCPDGYLDSYVGRQPQQGLEVLKGYLQQNVVGKIVVLAFFSNNISTNDVYEDLISSCGDREVYLVNVHIPQKEQTQINQILQNLADEHDNVHLIDWDAYVTGHDDWLYADGTHLTPAGQPEYVDMITNAIRQDFQDKAGGTVEEASSDDTSTDSTADSTDADSSQSSNGVQSSSADTAQQIGTTSDTQQAT
ncbi:MAG: acyltransferase family protein [Atopobiaceae bacterium]